MTLYICIHIFCKQKKKIPPKAFYPCLSHFKYCASYFPMVINKNEILMTVEQRSIKCSHVSINNSILIYSLGL